MWDQIKRVFRRLTPLEMATAELIEAELNKLEAQTAVEYSQAIVSYRTNQIKRLRSIVNDLTEAQPEAKL
jgi:predicted Zn-dependent protease